MGLPVIQTCGGCSYRHASLCDHPDASGELVPSVSIPRYTKRVGSHAAPPDWCPLRTPEPARLYTRAEVDRVAEAVRDAFGDGPFGQPSARDRLALAAIVDRVTGGGR